MSHGRCRLTQLQVDLALFDTFAVQISVTIANKLIANETLGAPFDTVLSLQILAHVCCEQKVHQDSAWRGFPGQHVPARKSGMEFWF